MRRFGALFLSLVLVCGLFAMPARAENEGAGDEPVIGMANPWTETEDLEEAIAGSGIDFEPPVEEALPVPDFEMHFWKYFYMDGTIEARYENVDNEMVIRASTELSGTDLSGDYNEYSEEWEENFKGLDVTCRGDGEKINCATFGTDEISFSVIFNAGEEGRGITAEELKSLVMGMQAVPAETLSGEDAGEEADEEELEENAEEKDLPEPGDVVNGFTAAELKEFPELGATMVWFEHAATGAKLMYIANDDTNRSFALGFRTDAIDNTGLPHVFEHSCLSGSEKYPSDALWFSLSYRTYNTFMNAFTYDRMTMYPIASLSEEQLLKLADYYTDSCLHPSILENESIYRTEAWRYRMADPEDDLTIEGTVYSEMLGATTIDTAAYYNAIRLSFPGSMLGNISGGDPDYIPDMTWQDLKDYHEKYYHPSNSFAVLYGDFDDYAAFLELLDGYYSEYEEREYERVDADYEPITEPVMESYAFPVENGSPTDHASRLVYSFVCKDEDWSDVNALDSFAQILSLPASPLQIRLKEEIPYGSFSCSLEPAGPELLLMFNAVDVDPEDADAFVSTVDEVIADIAENGFDSELMEGVNSTIAINNKLLRENSSVGVDVVSVNVGYNYSLTGDPWSYLDTVEYMNGLEERNEEGVYARVASEYLADSETCTLAVTYPEPGAKEEKDAALAEHLAGLKAEMSEEEIAAIVEETNKETEEQDISEMVASLQAVTVDSLPEEIKLYDVTDETDENGIRHIDAAAGVEGVGQASIFLDMTDLPGEYIHYFKLYTDLLGKLDSGEHTRAELASLMNRYLYSPAFYISLPDNEENKAVPYFRGTFIALDEDLEEAYDLVHELVYDTRTDDAEKVLDEVQAIKSGLKNQINAAPYAVELYRAMARSSGLYAYYSYANNLEYYDFLVSLEQKLTEDPEEALKGFEVVKEYLDNHTGAVALFAGNEESIAINRDLSDEFLMSLGEREITPVEYDLPVGEASEGLIVDTGVQFNMLYADYETLGIEGFEGGLDAVTSLVGDLFLIPLLRDQYGVYTPWNAALDKAGMYLISYRDPNVRETFDVYDSLADLIAGADVDEDTLDGYILSAYSGYAMPMGELSGAINAAMLTFEGESQEKTLEWMRQLKAVTPEKIAEYASIYRNLSENGVLATSGPASAIEANADLYEVILNPFGVVDATAIELSDVAEDHPQYEAVRFAFDNGLMAVKDGTEDEFGVDDPATVGDIMGAMYAYIGGARDPEEALGLFASYGSASPDLVLEDELTGEAAVELLSSLASAFGIDWSSDADDTVLTRGDLAELLMKFDGETE